MSLKDRLKLSKEPLYLMDGTAFVYRGFFANANLTRSDGLPTGALHIVAKVLLKLLREEKPKYFAFVMDGKGKNFRHDLYPDYKANRPPSPEGLAEQSEAVKELIKSLGIRLEISEHCEADDCIAGLADRFQAERPVIIIGMDKDLRQCLTSNVVMWDPAASAEKLLTLAAFREESGVDPDQWPDVQALIGDASDNIPGVRGIGPKTAMALFKDFHSLEDIRDRFDQVPEKIRKKLEGNLDAMFLYRRLTTLDTGQCRRLSLQDLELKPIETARTLTVLGEYELMSLKRDFSQLAQAGDLRGPDPKTAGVRQNVQMSILDAPNPDLPKVPEYSNVGQLPNLAGKNVALVPLPPLFGHYAPDTAPGYALGVLDEAGTSRDFYWLGAKSDLATSLAAAKTVVTADLKALLRQTQVWCSIAQDKWFDLSLAAYLLAPEDRDYGWPRLSARQATKTGLSQNLAGSLALSLYHDLLPALDNWGLSRLNKELELPLIRVLADMEQAGIRIDQAALANFLLEVQDELDRLTAGIYQSAGGEFNLRSAQQIGEILYKRLGLDTPKNTKGGQASTSQQVLETLAGEHPIINLILEFRKLEKMRSTYLEPLPRLAGPDGRVHTSFNQMTTATGRLSSSNPNLQNIPVRGEMGARMRSCFTAIPGHALISADYSQVELRVLAHFSQDPSLIEAFNNNEDIHRRTASLLFDAAIDRVDARQRRTAKTINFGLIYGMGARKLAGDLDIPIKEAKSFIERYFQRFAHIKAFFQQVEEQARKDAYVSTILGRRRPLPDINSPHAQDKALAERQAVNTVIQGSAADIIKLAMLRVQGDPELKSLGSRMLLQVHDELILEAPAQNARAVGHRLGQIMENPDPDWLRLRVPLVVDCGHGVNWGIAH